MARIRTVKPEFFTHPEIVRLSIPARLLFLSLLTQVDDEGRLYDQPRRIGANAFGEADRVQPDRLLTELAEHGRIRRYEAEGRRCLLVEHFRKHQRIDKPSSSTIPGPLPEDSPTPPRTLPEDSQGEVEVGSGTGNREQGSGTVALASRSRDPLFESLAMEYFGGWSHLTPKSRGELNGALAEIRAAGDATPDEIGKRAENHRLSDLGTATVSAFAKYWPMLRDGPVTRSNGRAPTLTEKMMGKAAALRAEGR